MHSFIYHLWHLAVLSLSFSHLKRTHFSHQKSRCDFCVWGVVILPFATASLYISFPGCVSSSPPPISSSPFCTALSFSQHGCYRRHWGLQWCPVSWKYPLSFLLPAVSWFIFNIPTSSSPPPPYVLHTYLWHLHTSLYFYLLFYFVPVRQWWKITFQQQILPLSLCTILQIRFFVCACTSDVTHTYMYIWPQLNNVNACEQKSFVWLVNSFRRGSFAMGLGGLNGLRWCFILKGSFTQNENCHHLLTLMLFQTSVTYFLLQNTKKDILMNVGNRTLPFYWPKK